MIEFNNLKKQIESDQNLIQEIQCYCDKDKVNFFDLKKKFVLKKRSFNNISEVYFWELSMLLDLDTYVTPSFPVEIDDKKIVIQKIEDLVIGDTIKNLDVKITGKVTLKHYWKAHLLAFILGSSDLSGKNIGINPQGLIRFFDNESSFSPFIEPIRREESFFVPYMSVSFDWPQYILKIDKALADELSIFVEELGSKKSLIRLYGDIRQLDVSSIISRIEILRKFKIKDKMTFFDFIKYLYPFLSPGLDELSCIVGVILHYKIGHGIALFFTTNLKKRPLLQKDLEAFRQWLAKYFPTS